MNFVSEDKKQINLPVAIGDIIYTYWLGCFNGCYFQTELFDKHFPKTNEGRCDISPCHISVDAIGENKLSLYNLGEVLNEWNIRYFTTKEEASDKANEIIKNNRETLLKLGFTLK